MKLPEKLKIAPEKIGDFVYKVADGPEIELARRFQHDCYLRAKFISETSPTGMIEDKYIENSTYLIALDSDSSGPEMTIAAVMRQIQQSSIGLPVLNEFEIFREYKEKLSHIPDREIIEMGSLSSLPRPNASKGLYASKGLFRFAWQRSKLMKHSIWLAGIDERLYKVYKAKLFFEFITMGHSDYYQGSVTVPALLDRAVQAKEMPVKAPALWNFFDQEFTPSS